MTGITIESPHESDIQKKVLFCAYFEVPYCKELGFYKNPENSAGRNLQIFLNKILGQFT